MSSQIPWDPFFLIGDLFFMSYGFESIDMIEVVDQLNAYDPVASDIVSKQLINFFVHAKRYYTC